MIPFPAAGFAFIKELRIIVPWEDHADELVGDSIIWVCGNVVYQLVDGRQCEFIGGSLLGNNGDESHEKIVVNVP